MSNIKDGYSYLRSHVLLGSIGQGRHVVRHRRACAPTSNIASFIFALRKEILGFSMSMGLRLAALRPAGAPLYYETFKMFLERCLPYKASLFVASCYFFKRFYVFIYFMKIILQCIVSIY